MLALLQSRWSTFRRHRTEPSIAASTVVCLFWVWVAIRTAAWIVIVLVSQPNASLDLIEWLSWGHSFEWGYPKHPPLPAWLAAGAARLSPGDVWGVYILSYLTAAGCLVAAWTLAREFLSPLQALLAAVCLDGLKFLTNDPAEWSNNVALEFGWAWAIVFAYRAISRDSTRWWAAFGLTIGLTFLCKYTIGLVLVPIALYLIVHHNARQQLRRPGPYLAATIAAAVFAPHVLWLVQHDFITITYAAERSTDGRWHARFTNPATFAIGQSLLLMPVLVCLMPDLRGRFRGIGFLHATFLGPVALVLIMSLVTGGQLRQIWGSPFWTLAGVWALTTFRSIPDPSATVRGLRRAVVVGIGMMAFVLVKQFAVPHLDPKPDRPHFPGKPLADEVNRRWSERYAQPFPIVAGEAWMAGNICCYSRHNPIMYSNGCVNYLMFDSKVCSWTSDAELIARGGVIVWDSEQLGDEVPAIVRTRFPTAIGQPPIVLPYQTRAPIPPAQIGLAFVPPAE